MQTKENQEPFLFYFISIKDEEEDDDDDPQSRQVTDSTNTLARRRKIRADVFCSMGHARLSLVGVLDIGGRGKTLAAIMTLTTTSTQQEIKGEEETKLVVLYDVRCTVSCWVYSIVISSKNDSSQSLWDSFNIYLTVVRRQQPRGGECHVVVCWWPSIYHRDQRVTPSSSFRSFCCCCCCWRDVGGRYEYVKGSSRRRKRRKSIEGRHFMAIAAAAAA